MFKIPKNIKNSKLDLLKRDIKIKNLPVNPSKGGMPEKLIKIKTTKVVIDWMLPMNLKSPKVFIYLISKIKKIKNIFISNIKYIDIFNNNRAKTYSL
jgi:hypothetical protein